MLGLFYKICNSAIILLQVPVLDPLLVPVRREPVQVLVPVQVLLRELLPVFVPQPFCIQSLQIKLTRTSASKELKQLLSSYTTLPPFKDFQMMVCHPPSASQEPYSIFYRCQDKSNAKITTLSLKVFPLKCYINKKKSAVLLP